MIDSKTIILPLMMVLLISSMVFVWAMVGGGDISRVGSDFQNYYYQASGQDFSLTEDGINRKLSSVHATNDPPLFSIVGQFFSYNNHAYFFFILLLFGLIIPVALAYLLKSWFVTLAYYSSNLFFWIIQEATYSSFIVVMFGLGVMMTKDRRIRLALLLLSIPTHSIGIIIVGLCWFVMEAKELMSKEFMGSLFCLSIGRYIFPASSNNSINIVPVQQQGLPVVGSAVTVSAVSSTTSVSNIIYYFSKFFNPVLGFLVVKGLLKRKRYEFIVVWFLLVVASFFVSSRLFFLATIFLFPLVVDGFNSLSKKHKWFVGLACVPFFLWNFVTWIADFYLRLFEVCPVFI